MRNTLIKFTFWFFFAFIFLPAHAQKKGYIPGYIVNSAGEMIKGQVKDRSSGPFFDLYNRIRFKPDNTLFRKKYSPDEILGYGFNNNHYESIPLVEESSFFQFRYHIDAHAGRVFLKVISRDGGLTCYHWEYVDDESNYLDYVPLFHRAGSNEMVRVSQGILGLKRNRLAEYFRDCPELVEAVKKKELNEVDEVYDFYIEHCGREIQGEPAE